MFQQLSTTMNLFFKILEHQTKGNNFCGVKITKNLTYIYYFSFLCYVVICLIVTEQRPYDLYTCTSMAQQENSFIFPDCLEPFVFSIQNASQKQM